MFLIVLVSEINAQHKCSACNGTGRKTYIYGTSGFGTNSRKYQCPVCHNWFSSKHSDTCNVCWGNRYVGGSNNGSYSSGGNTSGLEKLTPAELSYYYSLQDQLKGHKEPVYCTACKRTGRCHVCGGGGGSCWVCSGTGMCIACYGCGIARWDYVEPSPAEKQRIMTEIGNLVAKAQRR